MSDFLTWIPIAKFHVTRDWMMAILRQHEKRLPTNMEEEFRSLITLEIFETLSKRESIDEFEFVRIVDRVRHRLIREIHKKQSQVTLEGKQVESHQPNVTTIENEEIVELLKEALTLEDAAILENLMHGDSLKTVASSMKTTVWQVRQSVQRIRHIFNKLTS